MTFKTLLIPIFNQPNKSENIDELIIKGDEYSTVCPSTNPIVSPIEKLTIVIDEVTGFIIPSVFDYLLTRHKEGKDNSSFEARALRLYFDFVSMMPELKWDVGSSLPYERPIYQFSKFIEKQYESGVIAGTTAKNYFSCVVRFYTHHLKFNYPFQGGVPVEYTETIIKKYDNDLTSHITGLEIKVLSADCKPNIGSSKRTELIPFNDKEKKLFFSTLVDNGSEELLLICLLAYNSGMRADEIADFRVDMISRYSGQDEFILRLGPVSGHRTKKNSEMPVEVNGRIIALLLRYNKSKRYLNRLKKTKPDRANVFLDKNGKPYTQKMISTLFNEFMRDYIKTIDPDFYHKFHDLRVSFGVIIMKTCIDAGWKRSESLAYTKKQMRHQKVETTQLYLEYWESSIAIKKQALANEEVLEDVYQMLENT